MPSPHVMEEEVEVASLIRQKRLSGSTGAEF